MTGTFHDWLAPAALDRVVLLANHVLSGEPAALHRLRPHAGRVVRVEALGWPAWLPAWPQVELRLTAAGLLERIQEPERSPPEPDLRLEVDLSDPARVAWSLAAGMRPAVRVSGDAALAADIDWVATHVRWDLQADLERILGPAASQALAGLVAACARTLRDVARAWPGSAASDRPSTPGSGGEGPAAGTGPEGMR